MTNQSRYLLECWYHLVKDYGIWIKYTSIYDNAAVINTETGARNTVLDKVYCVRSLPNSVSHDTKFLAKLLGRTEVAESSFLCRVCDFPVGLVFKTGDYLLADKLKYRVINVEDYEGLLVHFTGDTFK